MDRLIWAVAVLAVLVTSEVGAQERATSSLEDDGRLIVGRVSENPKSTFPDVEAMANLLARRLSSPGKAIRGGAIVAADNREMIRLLMEGRVDVVSESPFSALEFEQAGVADILLLEKKRGVESYRTIFFSRVNGGIGRLEDLKGKTIGFEDRGSTSSFRYPMLVLKRHGLEAVYLARQDAIVPTGKVGYRFFHGELNIATAVVRGTADAGAFSNRDWQRDKRVPSRIKEQLEIIHLTPAIPRSLILIRKSMPAALRDRLRQTLLQLDRSEPDVRRALRSYYRVRGYEEIDGEAWSKLDALRDRELDKGPGVSR